MQNEHCHIEQQTMFFATMNHLTAVQDAIFKQSSNPN